MERENLKLFNIKYSKTLTTLPVTYTVALNVFLSLLSFLMAECCVAKQF